MSSAIQKPVRPAFFRLCCQEPFRIFFPLGLVVGIIGLALWPLFFSGALQVYPGWMHSRLMIEGFMGAFIIGFLGTAGPRLLGVAHFTGNELRTLLGLYASSVIAHLSARLPLGDALFFGVLLALVLILSRRFRARDDLPPPNFVLVGAGLFCGLLGAALVAITSFLGVSPRLFTFGLLTLSQGFVLLPILGAGVFLFPRFLGLPVDTELAELREPSLRWKSKAWLGAGVAAAIVLSFAVEAAGWLRSAGSLRCAAAVVYGVTQMSAVLKFGRGPVLGQCIRAALWMLLLGLLWPVFLPAYRVAGLHLVFIGGFMLTVLAVSTRVMLGHSGQLILCKRPLPFLIGAGVLLVVGLGARIGADFMPGMESRNLHLIYAAWLCIAAALVWGIRLVPRVFIEDSED